MCSWCLSAKAPVASLAAKAGNRRYVVVVVISLRDSLAVASLEWQRRPCCVAARIAWATATAAVSGTDAGGRRFRIGSPFARCSEFVGCCGRPVWSFSHGTQSQVHVFAGRLVAAVCAAEPERTLFAQSQHSSFWRCSPLFLPQSVGLGQLAQFAVGALSCRLDHCRNRGILQGRKSAGGVSHGDGKQQERPWLSHHRHCLFIDCQRHWQLATEKVTQHSSPFLSFLSIPSFVRIVLHNIFVVFTPPMHRSLSDDSDCVCFCCCCCFGLRFCCPSMNVNRKDSGFLSLL